MKWSCTSPMVTISGTAILAMSACGEEPRTTGSGTTLFRSGAVEGVGPLVASENRIYPSNEEEILEPIPISRDVVVLPEVLVEEAEPDAPTILRPMFDALWQTLGFPASGSFDADRRDPRRAQWYG